jgi:hypothetical protein
LSAQENHFLKRVVETLAEPRRESGKPSWSGWYFDLFYKSRADGDTWDAVVADVHTDVPAPLIGDPGCVLHQGVGNIDLLLLAVDNGPDRMVYAGPVLSHFELEMPGVTRKSDSEWRQDLQSGRRPPRPAWTGEYLVPGK